MMQGYNFTERLRRVLVMAREEASSLRHEYVGTEHLLLALIRVEDGVAAAALQNLNVNLNELKTSVIGAARPGSASGALATEFPYTSGAKKALELAMREARDLEHSYLSTEHLLLGLVCEESGVAAQCLLQVGVSAMAARKEVVRLISSDAIPADNPVDPPPVVTAIAIELTIDDGTTIRREFTRGIDAIQFLTRTVSMGARSRE